MFKWDEYRPEEQIKYKVKEVSIAVIIADICFLLRAGAQDVDTTAGDDGTGPQKEEKK